MHAAMTGWVPVVALALSDGAGRWLMQRRPPGKQHAGLWVFPGGKVESGETPAAALRREIAEELAIDVDTADLTPVAFAHQREAAGASPIVLMLYAARRWTGEPCPEPGAQIRWFEPDELRALPMPPLDTELLEALLRVPPA